MRFEVIAQTVKNTCIKSYDGNNSWWRFPAGWSISAAYYRFILHNVGGVVRCGYMKELHIIGCPTERENQSSTSKCENLFYCGIHFSSRSSSLTRSDLTFWVHGSKTGSILMTTFNVNYGKMSQSKWEWVCMKLTQIDRNCVPAGSPRTSLLGGSFTH